MMMTLAPYNARTERIRALIRIISGRTNVLFFLLALLSSSSPSSVLVSGFAPAPSHHNPVLSDTTTYSATSYTVLQATAEGSTDSGETDTESTASGGLVTAAGGASASKQQLVSAFTNLQVSDQYDAVLTGLCAKILDDTTAITADKAAVQLQDCQDLLQEMIQSKIPASPRSLAALIDSTAKTEDAKLMASVLSQCTRSRDGIVNYGSQQADILTFPWANPNAQVLCPDGRRKTAAERLGSVENVPTDDRATEVVAALTVGGVAVACELTNLLGITDVQPAANAVLFLLISVVALDNFYDILKSAWQFVIAQVAAGGDDKADNKKLFQLPEKSSLPLGLGSGKLTGSVVRGWTRLVTVDVERESQAEAAALVAAYVLGLPCFAYRPNALEASVLVVESASKDNNTEELDSLQSDSGILRMLIWLLAPVAAESAKYPQLIVSDPREASGFLDRLQEYYNDNNEQQQELADVLPPDNNNINDLIKWAYAEADVLLRRNKDAVTEVSNRLTGGAATIGDCVAVLENW